MTTLADGPLEIIDGDRGTNYPKQDEFNPNGHCLFLNAGNVTMNGFDFSDCAFISAEKDAMLRKGKLHRYDVVLTTRGTVGNVAYFNEPVRYDHIRINSGMVILRALSKELRPRYLYLFLRSPLFKAQVEALRTGSAQPQLPIRDINRIEIPIPPLYDQDAIIGTLGTLDDKIEINRRINETLEAMAQAIFKSWFVNFDPVRAKAEGKKPFGMDQKTAALFPDSFEDSELGKIPRGWRIGKINEFGKVICGKTPPKANQEFFGGPIPFIKIPDMHGNCFIVATEDSLTREGEKYQSNKTIPENSICVSCIATVGLVSMTSKKSQTNQQINSIVLNRESTTYFLYLMMKSIGQLLSNMGSAGSATLNVNTTDFSNIKILNPDEDILEKFHIISKPLFSAIKSNMKQNKILSQIRDTLLPKLMSGEIRLKNVEKLEEVRSNL